MSTVILISALQFFSWIPYYSWGLGKYRVYLNAGNYVLGLGVVLLSLVPGYLGLMIASKYLKLDPVYFRIIAVATAQLAGASVIAVTADFNKFVVGGLTLILAGAILTTFR